MALRGPPHPSPWTLTSTSTEPWRPCACGGPGPWPTESWTLAHAAPARGHGFPTHGQGLPARGHGLPAHGHGAPDLQVRGETLPAESVSSGRPTFGGRPRLPVSRPSGSRHQSRSAAPGGPGATSENTGGIRTRSNAASRDAPPGSHAMNYWDGTLAGLRGQAGGRGCGAGLGAPHPSWWQWQLSAEMVPASRHASLQNLPNGPPFVTRQSHAGCAHLAAVVVMWHPSNGICRRQARDVARLVGSAARVADGLTLCVECTPVRPRRSGQNAVGGKGSRYNEPHAPVAQADRASAF